MRLRAVLGASRAAGDAVRGGCQRGGDRVTSVEPELDLRAEARRHPLSLPGVDGLDEETRARAAINWRDRMASEHASSRVFAALLPQLMRAGIARRHQLAVASMVQQELDHAVLCARVVSALGEEPVAALPRLDPVPEHADAGPLEAVLRNVISISCCSETVAVALVGSEREQAATRSLRDTLQRILADEVKHARFGWRLLEETAPALDRDARRRLDAYLVVAFEHQLDFHGPFLELPPASDLAASYGAPCGPSSWRCFVDTMLQVTIPGLERHGLAAHDAWLTALLRRRERTPTPVPGPAAC
jgi:hypothetical protein